MDVSSFDIQTVEMGSNLVNNEPVPKQSPIVVPTKPLPESEYQ